MTSVTASSPRFAGLLFFVAAMFLASPAGTQSEEPPPPPLTGSIGFGIALTSGNSDSSSVNLSFEVGYDPPSRHVFKTTGLYLRGTNDGRLNVSQFQFNARDDYQLRPKVSLFVQTQYLRDTFKGIESLVAPTAGVGYMAIEDATTTLAFNAGMGGVWEKNVMQSTRTAGAATAGQKFTRKLSDTAEISEAVTALWKLESSGDALYNFNLGLTAALTARSQLKVQLLDSYKTRLTSGTRKKNDVSLIAAIVFKLS